MNYHEALASVGQTFNKCCGVSATYKRGSASFTITVNRSMLPVEDLVTLPHTPISLFFTNFYMERADMISGGVDYFPPKFGDKITTTQGTFKIVGRQGQYEMTALMASDASSTYDWVTSDQKRIIVTALKET